MILNKIGILLPIWHINRNLLFFMNSLFSALIIDDNLESRSTFKRALVKLGCYVKEADSAESGIQFLLQFPYTIVFASLCVKQMGARGIARWIRKNRPRTKCFIVTNWKGELERNILAIDGIDGVVHKPLLFAEIRDTLLEHLG